MKRLVYNGAKFGFVDTADLSAPRLMDLPRNPQKAAYGHRGMPHRLRNCTPVSSGGNGYKPGPLVDLGSDQCRYVLESGLMCGAKGYPYCEHHHALCYTGKVAWRSVRMKGLANGTHKVGWSK